MRVEGSEGSPCHFINVLLLADVIPTPDRRAVAANDEGSIGMVHSFQQVHVEQVDGTSQKCKKCKKRKTDPENPSSRRIPLN
jgi:hypothetical protein